MIMLFEFKLKISNMDSVAIEIKKKKRDYADLHIMLCYLTCIYEDLKMYYRKYLG